MARSLLMNDCIEPGSISIFAETSALGSAGLEMKQVAVRGYRFGCWVMPEFSIHVVYTDVEDGEFYSGASSLWELLVQYVPHVGSVL